ncbi:MAG: fatty acid desaturase family protein [Solirubrobacteraceae bacterium]
MISGYACLGSGAFVVLVSSGSTQLRSSALSSSTSETDYRSDQLAAIAAAFDGIRDAVRADLGPRDAAYIRRVIAVQRGLEVAGRVVLFGSGRRSAFVAGAALLTLSKILENMEIGHNVMHGQWDWMRDPAIHSASWEWDAVSTATSWKYAHNYQHHTYTNVLGKDRDLGYSAMRVDPGQPWHPIYLLQPVYGIAIAAVFEWGIALYDMELDAVHRGEKSWSRAKIELVALARKAARQTAKDYVVWPLLTGRAARSTLKANFAANVARNVWVHTIVFCGHIPEGAEVFSEAQLEQESRGGWYVRQILGSCNLDGNRLFHIMTGSLSFQIEHHLFPDLPSNRYPEIAPRVREVCDRHGLSYSSGRLGRQYGLVLKKIIRLSFPGGRSTPTREPPVSPNSARRYPNLETSVHAEPVS